MKQGDDAAAIRDATLALDQATRRFAELMMEAAVSTAITGKTMNAADEDLAKLSPHRTRWRRRSSSRRIRWVV